MTSVFRADLARRRLSDWTRDASERFGLREESSLQQWRGRILAALLGGALTFGLPPILIAISIFSKRGLWPMVVADLLAYAGVAYVLFSHRLSYRARAWSVSLSMFCIGTLTLTLAGFRTAGGVWLSMGALSAGILLGVRAGITMIIGNAIVFVVIGIAISLGAMPWAIGVSNALALWILSTVNTTMLGSMGTVSVGVMIAGLERESEARLHAESERRRGQHLEALGTLAGGIAHDFNNLLAPILANVELLQSSAVDDDQELLADIRTSAERGRDLIRRLLVLRRGEAIDRSTCDVAAIAQEVGRLVRTRAGQGVRIAVHVSPAPPVLASLAELHQVLMNLATNGVQAMPDGGDLTIEVDTACANGGLVTRVRVRDTGTGMSDALLARAFDPFFTTKGAQDGTGLGLATVRALVVSLGGTVEIASSPGLGTSVTVCLPGVITIASDSERDSPPARGALHPRIAPFSQREAGSPPVTPHQPIAALASIPHADPTEPALETSRQQASSRLVLLVDDEVVVLETARRVISALGHRAVAMSSAAAAEAWFAENGATCDLVITDYRMPGRTGPQLIESLRRARPGLPAVVVSGFTAEAAPQVRALGPSTMLIAKPYAMADLKAAMDRAASRRLALGD